MNNIDNFFKKISNKSFTIIFPATLLLSLINFILLLTIIIRLESPTIVASNNQENGGKNTVTNCQNNPDDLSTHIERLIVLDYLFNNRDENSDRELGVAELLVINSLFNCEDSLNF